MTPLHVILVFIGALLDLAGILAGHASDVTPVATMIVGGALGHAGSMGRSTGSLTRSTDKAEGEKTT